MQVFGSLDANRALFRSKRWKLNIRSIGLDNLPHLVQASQEDRVDLFRRHRHVLHVESNAVQQITQLELGQLNLTRLVASDENLVGVPRLSIARTVPEVCREGRRKVDGGSGGRLDQLDILSITAADELLYREVHVHGVNDAAQLFSLLATVPPFVLTVLMFHTHWSIETRTRVFACSEDSMSP